MKPTTVRKIVYEGALPIIVFATVTAAVSWRLVGQITVYGDTPLITKRSAQVLLEYFGNIWHSEALGTNQPWPFVHLFVIPLLRFADYIGVDLYHVMRVLAIFLSQASFYFFVKKVTNSVYVRLYSSVLYVINPVFIAYYNMGGTLIHWILLPVFVEQVYELASGRNDSLNNVLLISMIISVLFLASPMYLATYILLSLYPLSNYILRTRFSGMLKVFLMAFISIILVSPYAYASLHYYETSSRELPYVVISDFKYTYQELSPIKFMLLIGNKGSPQPLLGYHDGNIFIDIGGIVALSLFSLGVFSTIKRILIDEERHVKFFLKGILITSLFFIIVVLLIRLMVYSNLSLLIEKIPPLWTFRNPIKLQTGFALLFSLIVGCGIQELMHLLQILVNLLKSSTPKASIDGKLIRLLKFRCLMRMKGSTLFIISIVFFLSAAYPLLFNLVAFQGDMGLTQTYKHSLEKLYDEGLALLATNLDYRKDKRGVILPFDHKVELYIQFHAPSYYIRRLGEPSEAAAWLELALSSGNSNLISNALKLFSISEIILLNRSNSLYFPIFAPKMPAKELVGLLDEGLVTNSCCSCSILTLSNVLPVAYVANGILYTSNALALFSSSNNHFFDKRFVFVELPKVGIHISDGVYAEQYKFEPFLNGTYYIKCYNSDCNIKVRDSTNVKEIEMPVDNIQQALDIDKGKYILEAVFPATTRKLAENVSLNNSVVQLTEVDGDFHMTAYFRIIKHGTFTWNSFSLLLRSIDGDISYRFVFHVDGRVEVAKIKGIEYIPSIYIWNYGASFLNRDILVHLTKIGHNVVINVNNTSFHAPLPDIGERLVVEAYSEESITLVRDIVVASFDDGFPHLVVFINVGDKVFNDEVLVYRTRPSSLTIILPEHWVERGEPLVVVLNERFTNNWRSRGGWIKHFKANLFFNGFLIQPMGNIVTIEYGNQKTYERLLLLSSTTWTFVCSYSLAIAVLMSRQEKRRGSEQKFYLISNDPQ